MKRYAKPREVAEALGITERQVRRLAASGALPSVKIGKSVRLPLDRLEVLLERNARERRKGRGANGA